MIGDGKPLPAVKAKFARQRLTTVIEGGVGRIDAARAKEEFNSSRFRSKTQGIESPHEVRLGSANFVDLEPG